MQLVNWSGAIFGPGSEWLWSFAQFVVVALTLVAIYRQLRLQARVGAIEQVTEFRREAYSEQMLQYGLDVMIALRDHKDPADIPEAAVLGLGDFWENFAVLARAGHRDRKLLWHSDSATVQIVWAWLAPYVRKARGDARFGVPSYDDLEWLAGEMARMDREGGRPAVTSELVLSRTPQLITLQLELLRYAQLARREVPG